MTRKLYQIYLISEFLSKSKITSPPHFCRGSPLNLADKVAVPCGRAANSSNVGSEGVGFHRLRSRCLEVVGERENGRARGARERPARKAPE